MLDERDDRGLFEVLQPPTGGLTRLRSRIRRTERRRVRTWRLAGATAGLAGSDLLAIRLGLSDAPTEPVSIPPDRRHEFAVRRVPTTDERVVFYLVGSR